jgi:2-keto-4-pentenoate hydratase/2-oxohepta-3-ene-1,7-dioic acid hydratase in catechol pathway
MRECPRAKSRKFRQQRWASAHCPGKILTCLDYCSDHIAELNSATPKQPFFFLKPSSSILLPGSGPILRPKGVSLHYEVELGLIIGKTVRDLDPNDEQGALDAIQSEYNRSL